MLTTVAQNDKVKQKNTYQFVTVDKTISVHQ